METLETLEEFGKKLIELLTPVEKAGIYYDLSSASQTIAIYIFPENQKAFSVHLYHPDKEGRRLLVINGCYEKEVRIKGEEILEKFIQTLKKDFHIKEKECSAEHEWFVKNGILTIERI
jgi:hypothetical protein